jgi:NADPH2:quinone reductase
MMRAIRQHTFGGPEQLALEELPDLEPDAGQVRVAVQAAGVHLLDGSIRRGEPGPFGTVTLPMTPGREVAGVVDALGPGVDTGWLGRRVVVHLGAASGGYASQAVAPETALITLESHVDAADAVAMVGTGRTALAILDEAQLGPRDVVLVTAAAGGLGTLLVQAAANAGCLVVGVAGGASKVDRARSLGAGVAIDYFDGDWVRQVQAALGDRRITVALDGVGGVIGRAAFELVGPGGRMVLFGYSEGSPMDLDAEDLFVHGVAVTAAIGPRMFARPGGIQGLAEEAVKRLAADEWRPVVDRFPLAQAAEAHIALETRRTTGKVVLIP